MPAHGHPDQSFRGGRGLAIRSVRPRLAVAATRGTSGHRENCRGPPFWRNPRCARTALLRHIRPASRRQAVRPAERVGQLTRGCGRHDPAVRRRRGRRHRRHRRVRADAAEAGRRRLVDDHAQRLERAGKDEERRTARAPRASEPGRRSLQLDPGRPERRCPSGPVPRTSRRQGSATVVRYGS